MVEVVRQRRVGAGTCPRLNPGAYFLLGIFNEQFFKTVFIVSTGGRKIIYEQRRKIIYEQYGPPLGFLYGMRRRAEDAETHLRTKCQFLV